MNDFSANPQTGNGSYKPVDGSGLSILLVDDHESSRVSLERLLVRRHFKVLQSDTVKGGMAAFARHHFDLLIADISLPDGTGYDLIRAIKPKAPLVSVALTGHGSAGDIEQTSKAGFAIHLTKPIRMEVLDKALKEAVRILRASSKSTDK